MSARTQATWAPRPAMRLGFAPVWAVLRAAAAAAIVIAGCGAAIGWLYVLWRARVLGGGPRVPMALPLQRLAGGAGQPLVRLVLAWLPAGIAAGVLLAAAGVRRGALRTVLMFASSAALLLFLGAAADAVTASDPLGPHLAPQSGRWATWLGAALFAVGTAAIPSRGRAQP